ncbi:hypothetical protein AB1J02_29125 [Bacillus paranthracis]|jgi:predicted DNA-binding protein|uniref:Uncharacterized protein n=1 Tax=Bacillus paranthracis TaxID=2026186 RepID=A0AAX3QKA8_9BACI|nr:MULTISPECIES: hypothetical protein [Bacillus cereus group]KLA03390.1 hypothetical protein B4153_5940 [Bacillus cereus]MCC2414340.1 hypothetical protein [Bacillus paranthracis]MCU4739632.1 hypothetical protein [Bacillus paranthracis]MDG0882071.1 hypothetical protein [Bacillus paranthracis]MDX5892238.1 hypothetical protein [Bacillus cereus group sp. BfR-BA-01039]
MEEMVVLNVPVSKSFNHWLEYLSTETGIPKAYLIYFAVEHCVDKQSIQKFAVGLVEYIKANPDVFKKICGIEN